MMRRFSIRIQILALGMVFVLLMAASGVLSWKMQNAVSRDVHFTFDVVRQNELIAWVREDLEQARVDILRTQAGQEGAFDSLIGNLAEVTRDISASEGTFNEPWSQRARRLDYHERFEGLRADVATLSDDLLTIAGSRAERAFANLEIAPLYERLVAVIAEVDEMQEVVRMQTKVTEDETLEAVEQGQWLLAVSLAVVTATSFLLVMVFGRVLATPFKTAATSVNRLAEGDYAAEIGGTEYGDEAGMIARNLEELRDKLRAGDDEAARERVTNERRTALFRALGDAMGGLSQGRVDARIDTSEWSDLGESYEAICNDFNALSEKIGDLVSSLRDSSDMVQRNSQELSSMSTEMSRRSEVQAATLEESAAALEEMSSSVRAAAERAEEADQRAGAGRRRAEEGGAVMERALTAMSSIAASSDQITQIIGVIDDIAFQTNLLALNAGVEAARAGESGKGFSVVASEVRSLAQRASESAREIKALVSNSSQQVKDGGHLVEQTGETLSDIVRYVTEVSDMVGEIASAAKEQAAGLQEINVGVAELDKVTQQNAAMVGETSSASQQLSSEADRLTSQINRFMGAETGALEEVTPVTAPIGELDVPPPPAVSETAMKRAVGDNAAMWEDF